MFHLFFFQAYYLTQSAFVDMSIKLFYTGHGFPIEKLFDSVSVVPFPSQVLCGCRCVKFLTSRLKCVTLSVTAPHSTSGRSTGESPTGKKTWLCASVCGRDTVPQVQLGVCECPTGTARVGASWQAASLITRWVTAVVCLAVGAN